MASILIVDDDWQIRNLHSMALKGEGHELKTATDGDEALSFLKDGKFDLLITDLIMKRVNGDQLAREAKERWPAMPILMITGSKVPDECKVDMILTKPCSMAILRAQVKLLLKN